VQPLQQQVGMRHFGVQGHVQVCAPCQMSDPSDFSFGKLHRVAGDAALQTGSYLTAGISECVGVTSTPPPRQASADVSRSAHECPSQPPLAFLLYLATRPVTRPDRSGASFRHGAGEVWTLTHARKVSWAAPLNEGEGCSGLI